MKQVCRIKILSIGDNDWFPLIKLGSFGSIAFEKNYQSEVSARRAAEAFAKKYNISLKWTRR